MEILLLLLPALVKLALHLLTAKGYGLNGDELYYLACSDHLDWGYVDQPFLSILLLLVQRVLLGDSMLAIRLLPALAGFATVLFTGQLARKLGAGPFGRLLAQTCVIIAPVFLAEHHYYSMNSLDVLFWLTAFYLMVLILEDGRPAHWIGLGVVMGLGVQNKVGMLVLGFGLAVGLLMSGRRRLLLSSWAWLAVLAAALIVLPGVLWQAARDWPTLEWMHNAQAHKMAALSLPAFLKEQVFLLQPLTAPVWIIGLFSLLSGLPTNRFRPLAWCCLAVFAIVFVQGGKPYYLAPVYPLLFASGALAIERRLAGHCAKISVVLILAAGGVVTAPLGMPLLPVQTFLRYQDAIGLRPASGEEHAEGKLPSFYANMFGWPELVTLVGSVYRMLPAEEQLRCGIYCQDYMKAGAIDFYGRRIGLPAAISGHNNYWLWGSRGFSGAVMIVVGGDVVTLREWYAEVTEKARFRSEHTHPIHDDCPIFVVRGPRQPLSALWPRLKNYI